MPEADASPLHSGLFLDLDGTLADSLTALKNVYYSFLAAFGASGNEVEFQRLNGPPLGEIIERLRIDSQTAWNTGRSPAKILGHGVAGAANARPAVGAR